MGVGDAMAATSLRGSIQRLPLDLLDSVNGKRRSLAMLQSRGRAPRTRSRCATEIPAALTWGLRGIDLAVVARPQLVHSCEPPNPEPKPSEG